MSAGLQFFSDPRHEANHLFSLTYDHYSDKLGGGLAWLYFHGLDGENNSGYTGAGLAFSKPVHKANRGQLMASANLNCFIYTEQLFGYAAERLTTDSDDYHQMNAEPFIKFNKLLPSAGLLWNSYKIQTGISFSVPFRLYYGMKPSVEYHSQFTSIIYFSGKFEGIMNGLLSKPYKAEPEITALLSGRNFAIRTGMKMEHTKNNFGLFILNNISGEMHGLAGLIGWNIKNIRINISGGCLYSVPFQNISINGEAFIGVVIPRIRLNESKPWEPSEKKF